MSTTTTDNDTTSGAVGAVDARTATGRDEETSRDRTRAQEGAERGRPDPDTDETGQDGGEVEDQDERDEDEREEERGGNREAARRRHELREARAEVERLSAVVERFQRAEVERLIGDRLTDAGDLWRDGLTVADVLDDEGGVEAGKVEEAVAAVLSAHPHWGRSTARAADARRMGVGGRSAPSTPSEGSGVAGLHQAFGRLTGRG